MRPDYSGELLTLLVTSEPLSGVSAGPLARPLDRTLVEQWERQWLARVERFEMVGGAGKAYTGAEKQAGTEGRLLTQADELPQTLYHVSAKPGTPLAVRVALRIAKSGQSAVSTAPRVVASARRMPPGFPTLVIGLLCTAAAVPALAQQRLTETQFETIRLSKM